MQRTVVKATQAQIAHVTRNMREEDAKELLAGLPFDTIEEATDTLIFMCMKARMRFCVLLGNEPVALITAQEHWPGVWGVGMWATSKWKQVALTATKFAARVMNPQMAKAGCHRAHCWSHVDHKEAHNWLTVLGFEPEAIHEGWGKGGESFVCFAYVGGDHA